MIGGSRGTRAFLSPERRGVECGTARVVFNPRGVLLDEEKKESPGPCEFMLLLGMSASEELCDKAVAASFSLRKLLI